MGTCGGCGAALPSDASWCGQCYLPVNVVRPPVSAAAMVTTPPAPVPAQRLPDPAYAVAAPHPPSAPAAALEPTADIARRVWLVAGSIGLGAVVLGVMWFLSDGGRTEPSVLIRYALVATLALYALVSAGIVRYLAVTGTRLRWHDGSPVTGVVVGAATGLTLAVVLLGVVRAATGHASGDPRIALLVSEGGFDHIATAVLLTVVAAPLVEETLFRGLLAESFRARGRAAAVTVSACAFSAWHLQPASLRYYFFVGALLGGLYWTRGLVCSMSAHAAFNGLLALAAVLSVSTPGPTVVAGAVVLPAPHGWTTTWNHGELVELRGPAASSLTVMHKPVQVQPTADRLLSRIDAIAAGMPTGISLRTDTARIEQLPIGDAVRVDLVEHGHAGVMVLLPYGGELYQLVLGTAGSSRATSDFEKILHDVHG